MDELVVLGFTIVLASIAWGVNGVVEWFAEQRGRRETAARIRREMGLPPHERCRCDECIEWRAVPSNVTRLQ